MFKPKSDWETYADDLNSKIEDHAIKMFKAMKRDWEQGKGPEAGWAYAGNDNLTRYEHDEVQKRVREMMADYIKKNSINS